MGLPTLPTLPTLPITPITPIAPIATFLSQKTQPPHLTGNKNVTREEGGSLRGLGY